MDETKGFYSTKKNVNTWEQYFDNEFLSFLNELRFR